MKIAVSSSGKDLNSQIDPRFGRCAFFVIVESDDMNFEIYDNESLALGGGAGIQAAQFVASKGAGAVLTGNCGPNAVQTLRASHVEVFVGQSGTVREAIERFKRGKITSTEAANVADHYGMGGGGMGRGMGMGRGGGMGRGMGKGQGIGRAMGASGQSAAPAVSRDDTLKDLKEQANDLRRQLQEIETSMSALEKK